MLKERVNKYMRTYEAANDFDLPKKDEEWGLHILRIKVNALAGIVKEIINWANEVENVKVLTKER